MKELFKLLADCMKQEAEKHIITAPKPHRVKHAPTTVLVKSHGLEITFRREQVSNDTNSLRWYRLSVRQLNRWADVESFHELTNELVRMFFDGSVHDVRYAEKSLTTDFYQYRRPGWDKPIYDSFALNAVAWMDAFHKKLGGLEKYPLRCEVFEVDDRPVALGVDKPS